MTELKPRIHDESNGLDYVLVGDYYVPDLKLPEEHRPIGMWGRLHRTYLEQYRPTRFSALCLSGELHTYLADLDEQATERCSLIIEQMKQAEGVTETMKADNQMLWVLPYEVSVAFHLSNFKEENTMKMNRNEMEALYAFGCPNLKATVERLRMVAALAPDPVAKKLFYMLSVKLSAEGVERWYRCFYCKLRVLKNHREGCYGETYED